MDDKAKAASVEGKVRGGRVLTSQGMMTVWKAIKAGLATAEKPPSKHRTFTRSHMSRAAKMRRRQVAQASRRANRPAKRRTGIKPKRVRA